MPRTTVLLILSGVLLSACRADDAVGTLGRQEAIALARADAKRSGLGSYVAVEPYRTWESKKAWAFKFSRDPDAVGGDYTAVIHKQRRAVFVSYIEQ
jgi:hypothetical protein